MADGLHAPKRDPGTPESIIDDEPSGPGAVTSYLSVHLPAWGTSVVFHAAIILLCIFLVWQVKLEPTQESFAEASVMGQWNPEKKTNNWPPDETPDKVPEGPELPKFDEKMGPKGPTPPVISTDGISPGKTNHPKGPPSDVFKLPTPGSKGSRQREFRRIVYVIDASGSMTDSMDYVKGELKDAIRGLDEKTSFHVIFFSSGRAIEMPTRRPVPATRAHKDRAREFIKGITPAGRTDPTEAVKRAFAARPDLIYLLTDGEFDRSIVDMIGSLNRNKEVSVYTIGFLYSSGQEVLERIAKDNNGVYMSIAD